jgi:ABC-type multidrug transport system fused ATPase/permease subunit
MQKVNLTIDGYDIKKINLEWYRDNFGYVSQKALLFASTIRKNLLFGKKDATEEQMWDVLEKGKA